MDPNACLERLMMALRAHGTDGDAETDRDCDIAAIAAAGDMLQWFFRGGSISLLKKAMDNSSVSSEFTLAWAKLCDRLEDESAYSGPDELSGYGSTPAERAEQQETARRLK